MTTLFTNLLALALNMFPSQVCGMPDFSWAVIENTETCPVALGHLCYVGEWPAVWAGVACCQGDGMCRIALDGVCNRSERPACRIAA